MSERIIPVKDYLLVEVLPEEKKQGILIVPNANKKFRRGIILKVGPGLRSEDGEFIEVEFCVDEKIIFPLYSGITVKETTTTEGEIILLAASEVYAIFED